jgi:hypothetical protein
MRLLETEYKLSIFPFIDVEEMMERKQTYLTFLMDAANQYKPSRNFPPEHMDKYMTYVNESVSTADACEAKIRSDAPKHCTIRRTGCTILPPSCIIDLSLMTLGDTSGLQRSVLSLINALISQCDLEGWRVGKSGGHHEFVLKGGAGTRASSLLLIKGTKDAVASQIVKACQLWGEGAPAALPGRSAQRSAAQKVSII